MTLKEARRRAKSLKIRLVAFKQPTKNGYRYRVNGWYCRNVKDLSQAIVTLTRQAKREHLRKLDGYRLKYGYTIVPRKRKK